MSEKHLNGRWNRGFHFRSGQWIAVMALQEPNRGGAVRRTRFVRSGVRAVFVAGAWFHSKGAAVMDDRN